VRFRYLFAPLAITLLALLAGCGGGPAPEDPMPEAPVAMPDTPVPPTTTQPQPEPTTPPVTETETTASVIVTRDFGETALVSEEIIIGENTTALDAIKAAAEVETQYGGGFISAIEGLGTSYGGGGTAAEDWFFYVNGIAARVGAGAYTLSPGDVEHWDYHDWGFRQLIPALIGDFPEPFLHGTGGIVYPTRVVYQTDWEDAANTITDMLAGVGITNVAARTWDELTADERENSNLIIVGEPDFAPITELNEPWERLGFFAHFEDGVLKTFDIGGAAAGEYGAETGIIQSTQNIWNPDGIGAGENVVWMVSGTDEAGVAAAVQALTTRRDEFRYAAAVVAANDAVVRVP